MKEIERKDGKLENNKHKMDKKEFVMIKLYIFPTY